MSRGAISDAALVAHWGEGKSALAISYIYGVRRNEIVSRAFRLGLGERTPAPAATPARPVKKAPYDPNIDPRPDWLPRPAWLAVLYA